MTESMRPNGGQGPDPAGDLRAAMKARDTLATGLLRRLIALIDNAEAVALSPAQAAAVDLAGGASEWMATGAAFGAAEVPRKVLTADELAALFRAEADRTAAAAVEFDRVGRADVAAVARAEAALLGRYVDGGPDRSPS